MRTWGDYNSNRCLVSFLWLYTPFCELIMIVEPELSSLGYYCNISAPTKANIALLMTSDHSYDRRKAGGMDEYGLIAKCIQNGFANGKNNLPQLLLHFSSYRLFTHF